MDNNVEGADFALSTADVWSTTGVLLGIQVAHTAWRAERNAAREQDLPPSLPPAEQLNLFSMVIASLGVFALPVICRDESLAQVCFAAYAILYCLYPFALLGRADMLSHAFFASSDEDEPAAAEQAELRRLERAEFGVYCTPQERNVCAIATVLVCCVMLLGCVLPSSGMGVVAAACAIIPTAVLFFISVSRRTDELLSGGGGGGGKPQRSRRRYAPLRLRAASAGDVSLKEADPDFRYEVRFEVEEVDDGTDLGLELEENAEGWVEVVDIIPGTLASRTPHMVRGLRLSRLISGARAETNGWGLSVEQISQLLAEERPLILTFEYPWQREHDPNDGGREYYYNSETGETTHKRPRQLSAVLGNPSRPVQIGSQALSIFCELNFLCMMTVKHPFSPFKPAWLFIHLPILPILVTAMRAASMRRWEEESTAAQLRGGQRWRSRRSGQLETMPRAALSGARRTVSSSSSSLIISFLTYSSVVYVRCIVLAFVCTWRARLKCRCLLAISWHANRVRGCNLVAAR